MIRTEQLNKTGGPDRLARYLKKNQLKQTDQDGGHHDPSVSVRIAMHKGYEIEIRTTYEITIGGEPLTGHMGVGGDGRVHYHPIPNYSTGSMVDLITSVIDAFPDDYPPLEKRGKRKTKRSYLKQKKRTRHRKEA